MRRPVWNLVRTEPAALVALAFGLCLTLVMLASTAGAGIVEFGSDLWVMANAETLQHMGRTCLMGTAYLDGIEFENGVIEVDIAVDGRRTYAGINFRIQSPRDHEQFYVRPHRASLYPDALQYTPVFNGIGCWQLYNGEGATAAAELPENEWIHIRVEAAGDRARVFVGDEKTPSLVINRLGHGTSRGTLGLYGRRDGSAYFSNFSYGSDDALEFGPAPYEDTPPGLITSWEISQPFQLSVIEPGSHPDSQDLPPIEWQQATPEASGLVNLARYTGRTGRQPDCIYARATLESDAGGAREYLFGYSDYIEIYLNGDILFSGNSAYQKRDPSFLGIVGLFDAIHLPLKQGENELVFMVAESFGGWGFVCQDAKALFEHPRVTKAWKAEGGFRTPESVVFDEANRVFYVSNYDAYDPSGGQGKQAISRVSAGGDILDIEWAVGLNNPTGMALYEDRLFVAERSGVVAISTATGEVLERHAIPGAGFPNDVAVDASGGIYVSDSRMSVIYKRTDGEFVEWLSGGEIASPNGLHVAGDKLLVGCNGDTSLKSVELSDGSVGTVVKLCPGIIDGIGSDGAGNYLVSQWEGRMFLVTPGGEVEKLLDTSVPGTYCADFGYARGERLLVVPNFHNDTVTAYHIAE
jgi:hypothetical protein